MNYDEWEAKYRPRVMDPGAPLGSFMRYYIDVLDPRAAAVLSAGGEKHVWTVHHGEDDEKDDMEVVNGIGYVNRLGFVTCKVPCADLPGTHVVNIAET